MELTVKQLAERLLPLSVEGDVDSLARQLRHWTLSGILRTAGAVHTGAGKSRKYDEIELYWATIALELVRWRIPVGISDGIMIAARQANIIDDSIGYVKKASTGIQDIVMLAQTGLVDILPWSSVKFKILESPDDIKVHEGWAMDSPSILVINISALFAKLRS